MKNVWLSKEPKFWDTSCRKCKTGIVTDAFGKLRMLRGGG